jgi:hypothetical protein
VVISQIMNPLLWIFIAADALGLVALLWAMFKAPVGYEDSQGFHAGNKPVPVPVRPVTDPVVRRESAA